MKIKIYLKNGKLAYLRYSKKRLCDLQFEFLGIKHNIQEYRTLNNKIITDADIFDYEVLR